MAALASDVPTTMTVALISDPNAQLYPLRLMDRDMLSMTNLVYESLFVLDDTRNPVPSSLVNSYEMLGNGSTLVINLREGVMFHNGTELTAFDVIATLNSIAAIAADESIPANEKGMYVKVVDIFKTWTSDTQTPYTLTLTTSRAYYGALYALTFPIVQSQYADQPMPPGTGPYRIEYFSPGEELWLVGNENWYAAPPHISQLIGKYYTDIDQAMAAFESDEVDIIMTRSTNAVRYRGTASARSNAYDYDTRQLEVLLINSSSMLKEPKMRQAIAHAINKDLIVSNVYQRMVTATPSIMSSASWLYKSDPEVTSYEYSVEKANALLDELGWELKNNDGYRYQKTETGEDKELSLRLNYYDEAGNTLRQDAAGQIADMLRAVGIRIKLGSQTMETAASKLSPNISDYDLYLCAFNFDVVPDPSFLLLSNGYANYARYRSDDMNTMLKALQNSSEAADFKANWADIQQLVATDLPFVSLYWRDGVVLTRYPYSRMRDIREFELLRSINEYK